MLQLLPNEILVKIMSKTEKKTTRNCRLLSNRINQIIDTFELNKEDLKEFRIGPSVVVYSEMTRERNITIVDKNSDSKKRTYESCEELTKFLPSVAKNIGKVNKLKLDHIEISLALVDVLLTTEGLRKITKLQVIECEIDASVISRWMEYLECLNIKGFYSSNEQTVIATPVSKTFFNKVGLSFTYKTQFMETTPDLPWLDDELLENWESPGKSLQIYKCFTALTIDGIIRMIPKFSGQSKELGTLKNVHPEEIENALNAAGAEWFKYNRGDENITYTAYFRNNNEVSVCVIFSCPKPNPPLHIEQ